MTFPNAKQGPKRVAQPRASWKGYLKIAELTCPVALYAAASSSERITLNSGSGSAGVRLRRELVDSVTDEPVERGDKAKLEGRRIEKPKRVRPTPATDLIAALRESAGLGGKAPPARAPGRSQSRRGARRKAAG